MRTRPYAPATVRGVAHRSLALALALALAGCGASTAAAPEPADGDPAAGPDSLDEHIRRVRETVSGWEEGTGVAARIRRGAEAPVELLFADTSAPSWNEELALWTIATVAAGEDHTLLGHMMIGLAALDPRTLEGGPDRRARDLVLAVLLTDTPWSGQDPRAGWSINEGSATTMTLTRTPTGDLEGHFEGRLVGNDGQTLYVIERGFVYIKR